MKSERKYFPERDDRRPALGARVRQGYLSRNPERTVRIGVSRQEAWITFKNRAWSVCRDEIESSVPFAGWEALLRLCENPILEKLRHHLKHAGRTWEVNQFLGDNARLVVADDPTETDLDVSAVEQRGNKTHALKQKLLPS